MQPLEPDGTTGRGPSTGLWRAVDASANRATEALRVIEDVVRFTLDDVPLTTVAKDLRHDLVAVLTRPELVGRTAARDVAGDVGQGLDAAASLPRTGIADLVAANAARGAQALRSLEECAAVVAPDAGQGFERIRYRLYELERRVTTILRAQGRLAGVTLCVLLDSRDDVAVFERLVEGLFGVGVRMLQIRDKDLPIALITDRMQRAVAIARRHDPARPPLVVVNDRPDVAVAVGADGVHVGADDLPVPLVRRVLGPGGLIGSTTHSVAEARTAAAAGADYLGIGPCFPSTTKSFAEHAPPEFLQTVCRELAIPCFAIGGVTLERLDTLAALGVRRVAVASAVTRAGDPFRVARTLLDRLESLHQP